MGRPSSYKAEYSRIAKKMCELGAIDTEVAEALGVTKQTINAWKTAYPEFLDSLKTGKAPADERVKQSLYQRALGYFHPEDDIRVLNGEIKITPTIKHYPPDTTACIFWLKNRLPEEFRQNPEGESPDLAAAVIEIVRATRNAD